MCGLLELSAVSLVGKRMDFVAIAGNYDFCEMKEAVDFAYAHNAKVYIAIFMVTRKQKKARENSSVQFVSVSMQPHHR